jgi:capsular polysaccharide biosynthesis protein
MIGRGWADEPEKANPNDGREADVAGRRRGARDEEPSQVWTDDDFTVDNDLADDEVTADDLVVGMPTRPVVGPAIRRTVRWWSALGVVGLLIGAAVYTKVLPPPYKATSSVLVAQPSGQDATDAMLTDIAIAESHTVAQAAMRKLGLPVNDKSVQTFLGDYTAASLSSTVLQFTVKETSSSLAVSRAKALANTFLQVRNAELNSQLADTITALSQQVSQARLKASQLTQQINALSARRPLSTTQQAQLASLQTQRRQANAALTSLSQAADAYESTTRVATDSVIRGSTVLDQALPVPRSRFRYAALYIGGGLAGGLALGLVVVAIIALASTRLRRRDDIARALGAPVRLSLGGVRLARRGMAAANTAEIKQIVALLRRLMHSSGASPVSLALVAMDEPDVAAVALASLALSYAGEGQRVIVADLSPDATACRLLGGSKAGVHNLTFDGKQLVVARPEPDDVTPLGPIDAPALVSGDAPHFTRPLDRVYAAADVMLTLTMVDPAIGADHLSTWAADSVVVLTAGASTGTKIHTIGQMIRLAGVSLVSAILLGADQQDVSLGLIDPRVTGWIPAELGEPVTPQAPGRLAEPVTPPAPEGLADERDGTRGQVASTTVTN